MNEQELREKVENGELTKKLIDASTNGVDSLVCTGYKHSIGKDSYEPNALVKYCFEDIKKLSAMQYDFAAIKTEAAKLNMNRADYRDLCDMVCKRLGDTLEDICLKEIMTTASNFEDYCPYSSDKVVIYSTKPITKNVFMFDGDRYTVVESGKVEETPYYRLYISEVELTK